MGKSEKAKSMLVKTLLTLAFAFAMLITCTTVAKAATVPAKPAKVTGLKQTDASSSSVTIEWKALPGNDVEYRVEMYDGTKWIEKEDMAFSNSVEISGLNAGTAYQVRVQAYVPYVELYAKGNTHEVAGPVSSPIEVVTIPNDEPISLKHTKSTYTSITMKWSAVPGANTYRIEYWKAAGFGNYKQVTTTKTSIELKKLSKNSTYYITISAGRKNASGSFVKYADISGGVTAPVRPYKVSGLDVPYYWQYLKEIKVDCNNNNAADGYEWQLYTAYKGKDSKIKTVTSYWNYAFITKSVLKNHSFYKVRVRAYCKDSSGGKSYSQWSSWKYVCPQPDMEFRKTSKGIKVSWDKIKGADRYVVYMSTKQYSGYKKVATTKKTSKVITKFGKSRLKSGKKYYFYVVAQNKVGRKYYSGEAGNYGCWEVEIRR